MAERKSTNITRVDHQVSTEDRELRNRHKGAVLWFTGNLVKLRNYVLETREELRKCTWPTMDELKGSTVVVMISVIILGAFTVAVDRIL